MDSSGADNTGWCSGIGKVTWLNLALKADVSNQRSDGESAVYSTLARFVCSAYLPKATQINNVADLRCPLVKGAGSGMAGMAAAIPIQNLVWRRHTNQK